VPGNPFYQSNEWRELRTERLRIDGGMCTVIGCAASARFVDHKVARPPSCPVTCAEDRIDNLRSLCGYHDSQVKELRRGHPERRNGGEFKVKGCDAEGIPFDPKYARP
jgi:hypothetical protein